MGSWRERVRGSGAYELTAYQGYDNNNKKLPRKTKTIRPPGNISGKRLIKYLDTEAEKFQQEVDSGAHLDGSKLTFEELSRRWLKDYAERHLAPKTVYGYKDYLVRINQAIGHIRLDRLKPHHLNEFYANLAESGVRRDTKYALRPASAKMIKADKKEFADKAGVHIQTIDNLLSGGTTTMQIADKVSSALGSAVSKMFMPVGAQDGLKPKTIVEHHRVIRAILNKAYKWGVISSNVADRAEPPKVTQAEAKCYDEEQVLRLLEAMEREPLKHQAAICLGVFAGLRAGEMAGLEWLDVDFDNRCITINRARQYLPGMEAFDKIPKTERSKRTIEMSQVAIEILRRHRAEQQEIRLKLGDRWVESDKVLTQADGTPMNPQTPSKWFNKFLKRNGLPHITLHQLRHTYASLLLANGVDIATISNQLGHSKISVTLDVYSHYIRKRDRTAADKLDSLVKLRNRQPSTEGSDES